MVYLEQLLLRHKTDVHRCKSELCKVCNKAYIEPLFIPAQPIDPYKIRKLPKRWWVLDDDPFSWMGIINNLLCSLSACGDKIDDSSTTATCFSGSIASRGGGSSWIPSMHHSYDNSYRYEYRLFAHEEKIDDDDYSVPSDEQRLP